MLNRLLGLFSHDIGIDLGTANTMVLVRGKGIVVREPSVVAIHKKTKDILAIGADAKKMVGKTPANILAIRPLREGVISDFEITEQMLRFFINKVHQTPSRLPKIPRPRVVIGIPSGVTEVERRAVSDAARSAGAREVHLLEEPMAAAIGAGLSIEEPEGYMVVDIGGGTTEIAVISLGGIVVGKSIRIAGDAMDQNIIDYARKNFNLLLGERTAEQIKIDIGSAFPPEKGQNFPEEAVLRGRDLASGLPREIPVSAEEIREALNPAVSYIVRTIKDAIEETPPELLADIMKKGIVLAGGASQLRGFANLVAQETEIPTAVADDPMTCVVRGAGQVLEEIDLLKRVEVGT
jgi:rod shape-determining protein MreB